MELLSILKLVKKWLWLLLLAVLVGGAVGLAAGFLLPKTYEADTTLFVSSLNHGDSNSLVGNQQAAKALAAFPQSNSVLTATLRAVGDKSLSLTQLASMITVTNNSDTQFVTIQVRDRNPERAARLATEIAKQSASQFQAAATDNNRVQFLQNEIDKLSTEIDNQEAQLIALQNQPPPYSSDQTTRINQLTTSLGQLRQLYSQLETSYNSLTITQVIVMQSAQAPSKPVGAGPVVTAAMGMLIGLIAIVGVIIFIEQTDDVLRTPVKVGKATGLTTLAMVEHLPKLAKQTFHLNGHHKAEENTETIRLSPVVAKQAYRLQEHQALTVDATKQLIVQAKHGSVHDRHMVKNRMSHEFGQLETFLTLGVLLSGEGGQLVSDDKGIEALLVTSSEDGDGKTFIAARIALGLAKLGIETVLIDANLRTPKVHEIFGVSNNAGLSSLLMIRSVADPSSHMIDTISTNLRHTHEPKLTILPSGPLVESPAEALLSPRMSAILQQLSKKAFVVIDGPSILTASEAVILAEKASDVVMVVNAQHTTASELKQSLEILMRVDTNILGVVLNQASSLK